jgi:hypothetical protein
VIVTKFGWMGLDPLRVPQAASMQLGARDDFAQQLDSAVAANHDTPTETPVDGAARGESEPVAADAKANAHDGEADDLDDAIPSHTDAATTASTDGNQDVVVAPTQNPVMGESARRIPNGKDADSPLTPSPASAAAINADTLAQVTASARSNAYQTAGSALTGAAAAGNRANGAVGNATVAVGAATAQAANAQVSAKTVATGYRTLNKQAVLMTEQARDSVFRQVLFKLGKDSGEMRVKLEPPEFGALDLHLEVGKDGNCRLSIGAERSDLAALLRQDLEPLKHALQLQGLHVTHAEVHTNSGSNGSHAGADDQRNRSSADHSDEDAIAALPRVGSGFVTAQGLDYWA